MNFGDKDESSKLSVQTYIVHVGGSLGVVFGPTKFKNTYGLE